jgi:phage tail-like protein
MPFSNTEYLYKNLQSRYRREDEELSLKRFLQFFGTTLDEWDEKYDSFFENINPETASEAFIDFWLDRLFGWSWFPKNFTLAQKRTLYANFASHLARRGTKKGIELWLKDFGANAVVWLKQEFYDDFFYGEPHWSVDGPLFVLVEIISLKDWGSQDIETWEESFYDDGFYMGEPEARLTENEIETLLRFMLPVGQEMIFIWRQYEAVI